MSPEGAENLPRKIARFTKLNLERLRDHFRKMDMNPHEGKLRSSGMPADKMNIPDFPPIHDDTLPNKKAGPENK